MNLFKNIMKIDLPSIHTILRIDGLGGYFGTSCIDINMKTTHV